MVGGPARSTSDEKVELRVPGRLCLFGEHSDWAAHHEMHGGYCITIGTDQCIRASAKPCDRFVVKTILPDEPGRVSGRMMQIAFPWRAEALRSAARNKTEFFRYCAGVAHEVMTRIDTPSGIELHITETDLPLKKGVSSSAAVCVLVAKAFNRVCGLHLSRRELMELAYRGERLTGSQCGRMDQACIYGKRPVLLSFNKPESIDVKEIPCSDTIHLFFVDLAGRKDTVRILKDLQRCYPESRYLRRALGPENERIVGSACEALTHGDAERLGYLMNQAQAIFDRLIAPCCPGELESPLLHTLLGYGPLLKHVYGGKGVGSQGDGAAQFVARNVKDRDAAMRLVESAFPGMQCFPLTITEHGRESVNGGVKVSHPAEQKCTT